MAENLLLWLPCLSGEDRRAIGYAMIHHAPKNPLTKYATHYQAAYANELGFLKRQDVIDALLKAHGSPMVRFLPLRESTLAAARKLQEPCVHQQDEPVP